MLDPRNVNSSNNIENSPEKNSKDINVGMNLEKYKNTLNKNAIK